MKKLSIILAFIVLSGCTLLGKIQTKESTQQYVAGTEDLPLYPNFKPSGKDNLVYDSETGRIIDARYLNSKTEVTIVRDYYNRTLKQLGWQQLSSNSYRRDKEVLTLKIYEKSGVTFLNINIRPIQ